METVKLKCIIYVGTKTIRRVVFREGKSMEKLNTHTLSEEDAGDLIDNNYLSEKYINAIISIIKAWQRDPRHFKPEEMCIYACSKFRTLTEKQLFEIKSRIYYETGLYFFVLSEALEMLYIKNLLPDFNDRNRYIISINTCTIDINLLSPTNDIKTYHINSIGTSTLMKKLPKIQYEFNRKETMEYINYIKDELISALDNSNQKLESNFSDVAVYLGGEISFLNEFRYDLGKNRVFKDRDHIYQISTSSFKYQSINRLFQFSLEDLEKRFIGSKMYSGGWTYGMKACTLIAIALFDYLGVKTIIPSDYSILNGLFYKNFSNVVISGSLRRNAKVIKELTNYFQKNNINVLSPILEGPMNKRNILCEYYHMNAIKLCDTLIICNENDDGYIGEETLFDIGYAVANDKRIIAIKKPKNELFKLLPIEIGLYLGR